MIRKVLIIVIALLLTNNAQISGQTYSDDFNDNNSTGWTELPGGWTVRNGQYQGRYAYSVFTESGEIGGDFAFQIEAQIMQEEDDPGGADHITLFANAQFDPNTRVPPTEQYAFSVRQNGLKDAYLQKLPSGEFMASTGFVLDPKLSVHTYKMERVGSTIKCYVDGTLLLEWTDPSPYTGGYVGIRGGTPLLYWDNMNLNASGNIFTDDFNDNNSTGWTELPGGWTVRNGQYQGRYAYSVFTESGEVGEDYDFQIEAQIMQEEDDPGGADHITLFANSQFDPNTRVPPTEQYAFSVRQNGLKDAYLQKLPSGEFMASTGFVLDPKLSVHTYKTERMGSTIKCYVDGTLLLEWTDPSPYTGGYVGIRGGTPLLYWDNMTATLPPLSIGDSNEGNIPLEYSLSQNYPNPFNTTTTITYQIEKASMVKISIFNISGQFVETLVNQYKNVGSHSIKWNSNNLGSGLYFYRIEAGKFSAVKKCVILK